MDSMPLSIDLVNQILHPERKEHFDSPQENIVYLPLENFVTTIVNSDGELYTGHIDTKPDVISELKGQPEVKSNEK
jgi:hypothetical protein